MTRKDSWGCMQLCQRNAPHQGGSHLQGLAPNLCQVAQQGDCCARLAPSKVSWQPPNNIGGNHGRKGRDCLAPESTRHLQSMFVHDLRTSEASCQRPASMESALCTLCCCAV